MVKATDTNGKLCYKSGTSRLQLETQDVGWWGAYRVPVWDTLADVGTMHQYGMYLDEHCMILMDKIVLCHIPPHSLSKLSFQHLTSASLMTSSSTKELFIRIVCSASPLIPTALSYLIPALHPSLTFSPRGLIHSREIAPLVFAPWSVAESFPIGLSRLLQCLILYHLPQKITVTLLWALWVPLAFLRCLIGYLFTRSVGWAYPALFSHWALYESSSGVGSSIITHLIVFGGDGIIIFNKQTAWPAPILTAVFCWLEYRPWTYATAIAIALAIRLLQNVLPPRSSMPSPVNASNTPPRPLSKIVGACLATVIIPYILFALSPSTRSPLPASPNPHAPLLDILVLSYPRPIDTTAAAEMLATTIASYLPFLSPDGVFLSVFTHARNHYAFQQVQDSFDSNLVSFKTDSDDHPTDQDGHYLHVAEAFRWAMEKEHSAEWIMLVEDDFPVCGGRGAWEVITTVISQLETDRLQSVAAYAPSVKSGFIGTGGRWVPIFTSS